MLMDTKKVARGFQEPIRMRGEVVAPEGRQEACQNTTESILEVKRGVRENKRNMFSEGIVESGLLFRKSGQSCEIN